MFRMIFFCLIVFMVGNAFAAGEIPNNPKPFKKRRIGEPSPPNLSGDAASSQASQALEDNSVNFINNTGVGASIREATQAPVLNQSGDTDARGAVPALEHPVEVEMERSCDEYFRMKFHVNRYANDREGCSYMGTVPTYTAVSNRTGGRDFICVADVVCGSINSLIDPLWINQVTCNGINNWGPKNDLIACPDAYECLVANFNADYPPVFSSACDEEAAGGSGASETREI